MRHEVGTIYTTRTGKASLIRSRLSHVCGWLMFTEHLICAVHDSPARRGVLHGITDSGLSSSPRKKAVTPSPHFTQDQMATSFAQGDLGGHLNLPRKPTLQTAVR